MYLIKVKFLKDELATGRDYTYWCPEDVHIGDYVQINENMRGQVTAVNVPENEIEAYKEKVKTVLGKTRKFIFTFAADQEHADKFVVIWANNEIIAMNEMISQHGNSWSFQYTDVEWKDWNHRASDMGCVGMKTELKTEKAEELK